MEENEVKKEKTFYKKWWFWAIIFIFLIAIVISLLFIYNTDNNGVGTAGISKDEFEKIQIGNTTNYELNSIIDENNEWDNDEIYNKCVEEISEKKEDSKYTYTYKYYGEKGGYAIITLQADYSNGYFYNDVIVIEKQNFGLK